MRKLWVWLCVIVICGAILPKQVEAAGKYTTAEIKRICEEYNFKTNKYWSYNTSSGSATAYTASDSKANTVTSGNTGAAGWKGYSFAGGAECWAFAGFIGYKLSGHKNPYSTWDKLTSLDAIKKAGGVRVGDIIRTDNPAHSAIVYSVSDSGVIKVVECWGGSNNIIKVNTYFRGWSYNSTIEGIINNNTKFAFLLRAPDNYGNEADWTQLFAINAKFTYDKSVNSHSQPYADSTVAGSIEKGQTVTVKKFVTNKHGNIWAQLSDNSFVCFYDKNKDETYMTFKAHVAQPTHNTTYPSGNITVTADQGFWLKGPVTAEVPFLTVSTRIIDRQTGKDVTAVGSPVTVSPAATARKVELWVKNDSSCLDSRTLFKKLAGTSGWFTYQLNAQFGFTYEGKTFKFGSEMNLVSSNFTVGNPGELVEPSTPEVKGKLTIGNAVKNGDVLEIPVGIQGNPGLVGVSVEIGLPEEFKSFNAAAEGVGNVEDIAVYTDGPNGGNKLSLFTMGMMSGDGTLFRLYLPLKGISLKEFTLTVTFSSAGDANGQYVMLSSAEKVIKLSTGRVPGDADEDGSVGWADLILVLKQVSWGNQSINMSNADVTADGSVGWDDLILLLKYISWPGQVELK